MMPKLTKNDFWMYHSNTIVGANGLSDFVMSEYKKNMGSVVDDFKLLMDSDLSIIMRYFYKCEMISFYIEYYDLFLRHDLND